MKHILALLSLITIPSVLLADPIEEFEGFKWGASRTDIIQVKNNPDTLFDTFIVYADVPDEVGGYAVDSIGFQFKKGCSKLKESISEPCYLWGGYYVFEDKSNETFESITEQVSSRYGSYYTESINKREERDYYTKALLAYEVWTTREFLQPDGSSITVAKREYDRDFFNKLYRTNHKEGIQTIKVGYRSSEYNQVQKKKNQSKKKGF